MNVGEPAGADPMGGLIRRTAWLGTGAWWACGEYPQDCLQVFLRERYPLIPTGGVKAGEP